MSSPNNAPNVLPPEQWFRETYDGSIALCDPFSGEPLSVYGDLTPPNNPPKVFSEHTEFAGGYGIWRGSQQMSVALNGTELRVGVLLTDPADPNGLGSYADLRKNIGFFEVVGYANKRSVLREAQTRRTAQNIGSVTIGGEIVPDDTYMSQLLDAAGSLGRPVFNFDPSNNFDGKPLDDIAAGLQRVEDHVRLLGIGQDPSDTDMSVMASDMVYTNTLQWHGVGRAGLEVGKVWTDYGAYPKSVLLVVPAEHGDIARKTMVSGVGEGNVDALFARPEYAQITENELYAVTHQDGRIDRRYLQG